MALDGVSTCHTCCHPLSKDNMKAEKSGHLVGIVQHEVGDDSSPNGLQARRIQIRRSGVNSDDLPQTRHGETITACTPNPAKLDEKLEWRPKVSQHSTEYLSTRSSQVESSFNPLNETPPRPPQTRRVGETTSSQTSTDKMDPVFVHTWRRLPIVYCYRRDLACLSRRRSRSRSGRRSIKVGRIISG